MSGQPFSKILFDDALADIDLAPEGITVLGHAPVLWSGWEGDHHAVLVRDPGGSEHLILLSGTAAEGREGISALLAERLTAYEEAAARTRSLLDMLRKSRDRLP